ncbi:NACHT domain-containing protein [Kitasatospora sp. NPDC059673]|uniref:NACHT domain-containing protein n=1 Tax=Kitasatospora sp. NPDC059673 TaxID=3346901 RepID=UPI0036960DFB
MPFLAHHVAAVRGATQGSGFLLGPRLVLTAAHVGGSSPEAAVLDGTGWTPCTTVWRSTGLDAALLLADRELIPAGRFEPLRWGTVTTLDPVAGCHLTGFPLAGRDREGRLDTVQVLATLTPAAGQRTGRQVLVVQQHPPRRRRETDSPWSGLSGAGAVFRDRLLGIAVQDRTPDTWEHSQFDLVPMAALLTDPGFCAALISNLGELPYPEGISATEIADSDFERDYAAAIEADYGRIRIFGLRQAAGHGRRGWDLTTSYLSLEIRSTATTTGPDPGPGPQRAERILAGRRRVLIRGEAGSGKTTLVQWLAVGAMNGTLGEDLARFNHRVPLVLQLRKLHRKGVMQPRPEEFLTLDDRMCAERQPLGWAHRLLSTGRALLLVDGLDEVPTDQREEALDWLDRLLDHYPDTWTLATVRPSAVPHGWLGHLGFDELQLCPMNRQDRRHFVERWHEAALRELLTAQHTEAEAQRWRREIDLDQADLLRTLDTVPEVAQLTDSPLLCAMICALNRESDGALPRHRMALYRDAMSMMLVKRDEGRRVQGAEQLQASEEEQLAMLRRLAHWLVRNNQAEGRRRDAIAQLAKALRDLPAVARRTDAEQAYVHLLNRTGLITETGPDTFQFIHRTFQEYLAAMEFREERDFGLLAGHAADEQWGDVIRMTVGHCGRRERAELLTTVLAAAHTAPDELKPVIHLLAATCLPSAPELDGEVRDTVLARLRDHLPALLTGDATALQLAGVGEELVPLLREFAENEPDLLAGTRHLVPNVLGLIGGADALALLATLAEQEDPLPNVVHQWPRFEVDAFARQVVDRADLSAVHVQLHSPAQLDALVDHPTLRQVWLGGPAMPVDPWRWSQLADRIEYLTLSAIPGLQDISFLGQWTQLSGLGLYQCPELDDLTPLRGLPLEALAIRSVRAAEQRFDELWAILRDMRKLRILSLLTPDPAALTGREPLTGVWYLTLIDVPTDYPLAPLLPLFPGLEELSLIVAPHCTSLDLTQLPHHLPLVLTVPEGTAPPHLIGQEQFPPHHLTVHQLGSPAPPSRPDRG